MANYSGDGSAAAIAPDTGQKPGTAPTVDLPADGEPGNAASVLDVFKTLANHIAWLYNPVAIPSDYQTPLRIYRNAKSYILNKFDALGLLVGALRYETAFPIRFGEKNTTVDGGMYTMPFGTRQTGPSNASDPLPGWWWGCSSAVTAVTNHITNQPPVIDGGNRLVKPGRMRISTAVNAGDIAGIIKQYGTSYSFAENVVCSLEFKIPSIVKTGFLLAGWFVAGAGDDPATQRGVYFVADAGVTNWRVMARAAAGTTVVDTGFAANANPKEMRLVYVGTELEFANQRRVLAFINGTLVAEITTDLPAFSDVPAPNFVVKMTDAVTPPELDVADVSEQHFIVVP